MSLSVARDPVWAFVTHRSRFLWRRTNEKHVFFVSFDSFVHSLCVYLCGSFAFRRPEICTKHAGRLNKRISLFFFSSFLGFPAVTSSWTDLQMIIILRANLLTRLHVVVLYTALQLATKSEKPSANGMRLRRKVRLSNHSQKIAFELVVVLLFLWPCARTGLMTHVHQ